MNTVRNADAATVDAFLDGVSKRLSTISTAKGASIGIVVGALFVFVTLLHPKSNVVTAVVIALLALSGAAAGLYVSRKRRSAIALLVERKAPECRNLVVTAQQLIARQSPLTSVAPIVFRQAAQAVRNLTASALLPAGRVIAMVAVSVAMLVVTVMIPKGEALSAAAEKLETIGAALAIQRVDATIVAPAYVTRASQTLRDPARIEALAGSHITLVVKSNAALLEVETMRGKQSVAPDGSETFKVDVIADADGFIALQPSSANGAVGTRKLIGLTVTPDAPPHVRITAPAKDMMFPDANRTLDLAIEADDDIALASLKLKYTQVSGSGERYTFREGELPLQVTRASDKVWTAKVSWNLATLALDAGDMVVYRAVAADKRPGAMGIESDSYIAEILMPGSDAAAGFAIDPDQERYALSQQMIILKTERLNAKRASLSPQSFADEANEIAVEQLRVRAEFVFMMGGELADNPTPEQDMTMLHEEAEAEGEADILDGRDANRGRVALQQAIRSMSSAATLLNVANVAEALDKERAALKQVEQAFSHTRIILRALTEVEKLDLTRRMTGPLLDAGRDVHPSANPDESARIVALRAVLTGVAELSASTSSPNDANSSATALAEQALRVAPSEKPIQEIAARLTDAAAAFAKRDASRARAALDDAAVKITALVRGEIVTAPTRTRTLQSDRISGAVADLLRASRPQK
jgi:disulfide bond formation protein DsbB